MTSRSGKARAALSVLATAVQDSAAICEAQIRLCHQALHLPGTAEAELSGEIPDDASAVFATRARDCQARLQSTHERIGRIAGLREAAASAGDCLLAAVAAARRELDALPPQSQVGALDDFLF